MDSNEKHTSAAAALRACLAGAVKDLVRALKTGPVEDRLLAAEVRRNARRAGLA